MNTAGRPCEQYTVVALGTGRCSCSKGLCYNGTMVHDCHAIVIARRALLRYELLNRISISWAQEYFYSQYSQACYWYWVTLPVPQDIEFEIKYLFKCLHFIIIERHVRYSTVNWLFQKCGLSVLTHQNDECCFVYYLFYYSGLWQHLLQSCFLCMCRM